jgi:hypothetical protein
MKIYLDEKLPEKYMPLSWIRSYILRISGEANAPGR